MFHHNQSHRMKESSKELLANGLDFLERSLDEFKKSPKFSILHFAIAIEVLLKSRLVLEHWSLVVSRDANIEKYKKGDFLSVNLDEAVKRLKNIAGENIADNEIASFKTIASHRNRIIHFYHGEIDPKKNKDDLEKIIKEQCECWYHLKVLFTKKWKEHFLAFLPKFTILDSKMRQHAEYLSTIYDKQKSKIKQEKSAGAKILKCSYCSFESLPIKPVAEKLDHGSCLVCNHGSVQLTLKCEECESDIKFINEGWGECSDCGQKYEPEDVYRLVDDLGHDSSEWPDNICPANCSSCDGYHTIAAIGDKFICTSCFDFFDHIGSCEWCHEHCSGDLTNSYFSGCAICEGHSGWHRD